MPDLEITIAFGDETQRVTLVDFGPALLRPDAKERPNVLEQVGLALDKIAEAAGVYDGYVEAMAKAKAVMRAADFEQLVANAPPDHRSRLERASVVPPATERKPA